MRSPFLAATCTVALALVPLVGGCGSVTAGGADAGDASHDVLSDASDGDASSTEGGAGGTAAAGTGGGGAGAGGGGHGGATIDAGQADTSDAAKVDAPHDAPPPVDTAAGDARPDATCPAGFDDCNHDPKDGCEQALDDDLHCGGCGVRCQSPAPFCATNGGPHCANPAMTLAGQRLELACTGPGNGVAELCSSQAAGTSCPDAGHIVTRTLTFGGRPGVPYDVTVRIRGVVEPKAYAGGRGPGDHFYVGGQPTPTRYNVYRLAVSAPNQVYYLNFDEAEGESYRVMALDHTKVLRINGGATVTLDVVDIDCAMVRNCRSFATATCAPYVVAGIPPAPSGYDGQFLQLDVTAVANGS